MENYFIAVLICLLPFVIGGIWYALHDSVSLKLPTPQKTLSPPSPKAKDFMLREYYYDRFSHPKVYSSLLVNLKNVNKYDPETREHDKMDDWFRKNTRLLMHNGYCLAYINSYGHLESTFWKNIEELNLHPEQDIVFQKFLVSVHITNWEIWMRNYNNLLFNYSLRYTLLPEIEDVLKKDARFETSLQSYKFAREYANRKAAVNT